MPTNPVPPKPEDNMGATGDLGVRVIHPNGSSEQIRPRPSVITKILRWLFN